MHELARKPKASQQAPPGRQPVQARFGQSLRASSILQMQRTIGNRAVVRRQPAPQPLDYDRDVRRGRLSFDPKLTRDDMIRNLNDRTRAGHLTSFQVKGAQNGSQAELFLLYLIFQTSRKSNWGTESDLVTTIGHPAPGAPAPLGQVTLRFDRQGAATAELVSASPVTAPPRMSFADGISKLTGDFGFSSVKGWQDNPTSAAEISDVVGALEVLRQRAPQDMAALKGIELIRVASLGGNTAGEFSMLGRWLKLANGAFDANAYQFFGGGAASPSRPASYQPILHEVGHAVEVEALRFAHESHEKAAAEVEEVRKRIEDEGKTFDTEREQAVKDKKLKQFYKRKEESYKKNNADQAQANDRAREEGRKVKDTKVDAAIVQTFQNEASAASASAASLLAAAKTAVQNLLPAEQQSSSAYAKAVEDTAAAITTFAADVQTGRAPLDDLENALLKKVADRNKARDQLKAQSATHKALAPLDLAAKAQDRWCEAERALVRGRERTRRLQKFVELVTANNIRKFTRYSADNWKLKPGEFYAEAYSLWLVDPDFLKTNYLAVYNFFQNGDYRK